METQVISSSQGFRTRTHGVWGTPAAMEPPGALAPPAWEMRPALSWSVSQKGGSDWDACASILTGHSDWMEWMPGSLRGGRPCFQSTRGPLGVGTEPRGPWRRGQRWVVSQGQQDTDHIRFGSPPGAGAVDGPALGAASRLLSSSPRKEDGLVHHPTSFLPAAPSRVVSIPPAP